MSETLIWVHAAASGVPSDVPRSDSPAAKRKYPAADYNVHYIGGKACGVKPDNKGASRWGGCARLVGHGGEHIAYSGDVPVAAWTTGFTERAGYFPIYHFIHPKHREGIPDDTYIEYKDEPPWERSPVSDPPCGESDPSGRFSCTRKPNHRGAHEHYINVVLLASWSWRKVEAA